MATQGAKCELGFAITLDLNICEKMDPRLNSIHSKVIAKDICGSGGGGKARKLLAKWQLLQGQLAKACVSQVSFLNLFDGLSGALKEKIARRKQRINQYQDEEMAKRSFIGSPLADSENTEKFYSYKLLRTELHSQKFATFIDLAVKEDNSAFCWTCGKSRTEMTKRRYVVINRFAAVQMRAEEEKEDGEDYCGARAEWYANVVVTKSVLQGWLDAEVQVWAPGGVTVVAGVPVLVRLGVRNEHGRTYKSEVTGLRLEGVDQNSRVRLKYQFKGFLNLGDLQKAAAEWGHRCTFQVSVEYCRRVEAEPEISVRDQGPESTGVLCPVVPSEGERDIRVHTRDGLLVLKRRGFGTCNYPKVFKLLRSQMRLMEDHISVHLEDFSSHAVLNALSRTVRGLSGGLEDPYDVHQLQELLKLAKQLKSMQLEVWCVKRLLDGLTPANFLENSEVLTTFSWTPSIVAKLRSYMLENFVEVALASKKLPDVLQYQNVVLALIFMVNPKEFNEVDQ